MVKKKKANSLDPSARSQARATRYRQISARIGQAVAKATVMCLLGVPRLPLPPFFTIVDWLTTNPIINTRIRASSNNVSHKIHAAMHFQTYILSSRVGGPDCGTVECPPGHTITLTVYSLPVSIRECSVDASERSGNPQENALWTPVNADPGIHKRTLCGRQ